MAGPNLGGRYHPPVALALPSHRDLASARDGGSGRHHHGSRLASAGLGNAAAASFTSRGATSAVGLAWFRRAGRYRCAAVLFRGRETLRQSRLSIENAPTGIGGSA